MLKIFLPVLFLIFSYSTQAQKQVFDSLSNRLAKEKIDSNRATLLWSMAHAIGLYNPDTSIFLAQKALYLSRKIKYTEGESRSLSVLAINFRQLGDYKKALEFFLEKLKFEEEQNSPRNYASTLINIGIVYVFQEQYDMALGYYKKADSVVTSNNIDDLKYFIANNLGDLHERLTNYDAAYYYFNRAIDIAIELDDGDFKGASILGLGHVYLKQHKLDSSLQAYKKAIQLLQAADDEDLICEGYLGLANLYIEKGDTDSALYYGGLSYAMAEKDGFESRQLNAAHFLTTQYEAAGNIKKSFEFLKITQKLKDSINSESQIRALQTLSINENLRQNEIAENKRRVENERLQQLQLLGIGLFIPLLFLSTFLLSRRKINQRLIRFLGIISLLIFFEYLLLLLHPYVVEFTHHTPVYEILIFVAIASILVPAHHKMEHLFIQRLNLKKSQAAAKDAEETIKKNDDDNIDTKALHLKGNDEANHEKQKNNL